MPYGPFVRARLRMFAKLPEPGISVMLLRTQASHFPFNKIVGIDRLKMG